MPKSRCNKSPWQQRCERVIGAVIKAGLYPSVHLLFSCVDGCRVLEHNLLDGVAAVKAGFDDAQVAALVAALGARPGDLLLLVGGP